VLGLGKYVSKNPSKIAGLSSIFSLFHGFFALFDQRTESLPDFLTFNATRIYKPTLIATFEIALHQYEDISS